MTVIQILLGVLVIVAFAGSVSIAAHVRSVEERLQSVEGLLREELEDFYLPRHSGVKKARRSADASLLQAVAYGAKAPLIAEDEAEDEYLSQWGLRIPASRLRPDHSGST